MRTGAAAFDRQHRIQQQHALPRPRRQTTVTRLQMSVRAPARNGRIGHVGIDLLKDVQQRRRFFDARLHREAQAVRLIRTVIRILADDHDANVFERRQIERGEDLRTAWIDRLARFALLDAGTRAGCACTSCRTRRAARASMTRATPRDRKPRAPVTPARLAAACAGTAARRESTSSSSATSRADRCRRLRRPSAASRTRAR